MKQSPSLARPEKSLLFVAPMARAVLGDLKTKTRRCAQFKTPPGLNLSFSGLSVARSGNVWHLTSRGTMACWQERSEALLSPYGVEGDRIWGRETFYAWGRWETRFSTKKGRDEWHFVDLTLECGHAYRYAADENVTTDRRQTGVVRWWKRPAIFMPRAASRILLEITEVSIERLGAISEVDAVAEGISISSKVRRSDTCYGIYECQMPDGKTHFNDSAVDLFRTLWTQINGDDSWDPSIWVWVISFRRVPAHTGGQPCQ